MIARLKEFGRRRLLSVVIAVLLAFSGGVAAQDKFPGSHWDSVAPADYGWSPALLAEVQEASARLHLTAVMVIHHGSAIMQWGDTTKRTELASVRKSLLSALIGIAVADNKISLDRTLGQLGIDDNAPSLTDLEKQATVRMLLEARSGIYHPALYETRGMANLRPPRGSHPPGSFFYYNNWDFNALGTIYEQATGTGIYDAFDRLIAKPIGMQDYRPADGTYFHGPDSRHRAYPLRMSARDLARFALLYLKKGEWSGRQIVPAEWVRESTRPHSDVSDLPLGYGYLWWTNPAPPASGLLPEGTFFAWGAGGQYAFVIPLHDVVVVYRVDMDQPLPQPRFGDIVGLLRLTLKAGGFGDSR